MNSTVNQLPDWIPPSLHAYVPVVIGAAYALLILLIGWIGSKWVSRLVLSGLRKAKVDEALSRFLSSMAQYTFLAAAVITSLGKVGVETTSLVALLASAGLAVGLALQGSLSNFAAGVMILFFRPFALRDKIQAAGQTGTVLDIGIFVTTMITGNHERIIVPNSAIIGGVITNYNTEGTLRAEIKFSVPYGSELEKVLSVARDAAKRSELVLADPAPVVNLLNFSEAGLDLVVMPYAKTADFAAMMHNVKKTLFEDLSKTFYKAP